MNTRAAAQVLAVSVFSVRRLAQQGELRARRFGRNGNYRFLVEDLEEFVCGRLSTGAQSSRRRPGSRSRHARRPGAGTPLMTDDRLTEEERDLYAALADALGVELVELPVAEVEDARRKAAA